MVMRMTRRRVVAGLVLLAVSAALAGAVALRLAKRSAINEPAGVAATVALEFASTDLAYVETTPLARWLPVSGTSGKALRPRCARPAAA